VILLCAIPVNTHASGENTSNQLSSISLGGSQQVERFNFFLSRQEYDSDSTGLQTQASLKLKSPDRAVFYSLMPGIILHGSGHIYAGKTGTGIALFGAELVGVGLMYVGAAEGIEENLSGDEGETLFFIGLPLFLGSWVYDLIKSPSVVKKQNAELFIKEPAGVELRMKDGRPRLVAVWRF
jgi:hypothetical protein